MRWKTRFKHYFVYNKVSKCENENFARLSLFPNLLEESIKRNVLC